MCCLLPSVEGERGENLGVGAPSRSFCLGGHVQAAWGGRGPGATCLEVACPPRSVPRGPRVRSPSSGLPSIRIALGQNLERSRFIGKFRASWLFQSDFNQEMVVRSQDVSPGPAAMSAAGAAAVGRPERHVWSVCPAHTLPRQLSYRAREIFGKFLSSKATTPVNIDSQAQLADDILSAPHPDMFKEQQLQVMAPAGAGGGALECRPRRRQPLQQVEWRPPHTGLPSQGQGAAGPGAGRPVTASLSVGSSLYASARDHRFMGIDIHRAPRCLGLFSFRTAR